MKYKYLTLKYALINASFMMGMCAASYAYNFLSQSGFSDGQVGLIITSVSLVGLFLSPMAAQFVDKSEKVDEKAFISYAMIVSIAAAVLLAFAPDGSILMILADIILFTCATIGYPFFNTMAFIYEKDGQTINYGLCRGIGSLAFAVGSFLVGKLWSMMGKSVLPWYLAVFCALSLLIIRTMPTPSKSPVKEETREVRRDLSYIEFFKKYRNVAMVTVALVFFYFTHMLINTYAAKIIGNIVGEGGDVESIQGTASFIAAVLELPAMFGFSKLCEKFSINQLLIFAAIMYSVKHIATWMAGSVPMLYFAYALQMFSYAIITPAVVYFTNANVNEEDRNKGQAVTMMGTTIGGLLASSIGGTLFQTTGVSTVLLIGAVFSCIGTVLMVLALREKKA